LPRVPAARAATRAVRAPAPPERRRPVRRRPIERSARAVAAPASRAAQRLGSARSDDPSLCGRRMAAQRHADRLV
jgi:hypothetical protein